MPDPVEVELELVQLSQNIVVSLNLSVGALDQVTGPVELGHGEHLALFAEVHHLLLDLAHHAVEIAPQGRQGGAVE